MSKVPYYVGLENARPSHLKNRSVPYVATKATPFISKMSHWAHHRNFWPFPFASACCSLEFQSLEESSLNIEPFGLNLENWQPDESDLLIVGGIITEKILPHIVDVYQRMPSRKWVLAVGSCVCSGGGYRSYSMVQGLGREIPIDVMVPGCPPSPEAIVAGIELIKEKIDHAQEKTSFLVN